MSVGEMLSGLSQPWTYVHKYKRIDTCSNKSVEYVSFISAAEHSRKTVSAYFMSLADY